MQEYHDWKMIECYMQCKSVDVSETAGKFGNNTNKLDIIKINRPI